MLFTGREERRSIFRLLETSRKIILHHGSFNKLQNLLGTFAQIFNTLYHFPCNHLNLAGRRFGIFRQMTNLTRHHGKALTEFSCSRRLNTRVQQDVAIATEESATGITLIAQSSTEITSKASEVVGRIRNRPLQRRHGLLINADCIFL